MANLIPDRDTECRVYAMLTMAHALTAETDRIAALIADKLGIDPVDEAITEAVWNFDDAATALMFLKGDLPDPADRTLT